MLQLEVAGTVIQLEDTDAALIIYCHPSWKQKTIRAHNGSYFDGSAKVISRAVGEDTVYAAVFPRISLAHYLSLYTTQSSVQCEIDGMIKLDTISLFPGNVTEVDWTEIKWG